MILCVCISECEWGVWACVCMRESGMCV